MRRALIAIALSVLAVTLIAPAAQGSQMERYFQALSLSGSYPGQIFLTVIYKDNHGNGKFKPRWAIAYSLLAQVSCDPGGTSDLSITKTEDSPDGHYKQRIRKGRFATRFEAELSPQVAPPHGDLIGRITRKNRINGAFNVEDWDPNPGGRENCISSGSFTATPCKSGDPRFSDSNLPFCRHIAAQ